MNEPKVGEWWMCKSETSRTCPMIKTNKGWGSIRNENGVVETAYSQSNKVLVPLYQMVKA